MKKLITQRTLIILLIISVIFSINLLVSTNNITAQSKKQPDNDECIMCHDDPEINMVKKGKTISLTVKGYTLTRSVHKNLKCTDCHKGFDPFDIPHKAKISPINCMDCHKDAPKKHKFHSQMVEAVSKNSPDGNCKGCHGYHDVKKSNAPGAKTGFANSTEFCGSCHKEEMKMHLGSEHAVMLSKNNPDAPTCIFCHEQPITRNVVKDKAQLKINQEKLCITCHLNTPQNKYSKTLISYESSVHGKALANGNSNAATCIDCHGVHDLKKATNTSSTVNRFKIPEVCGKCHVTVTHEYSMSIHGISLEKGNPDVPGCTYCHGEHDIKPQMKIDEKVIQDNKMSFDKLSSTKMLECVNCHTDEKMMKKYNLSTVKKAHEWLPNIVKHWETVRCVDCHSSYDPPNLSHNLLAREQVIKKCEDCHSKNSILMTKLYKHEKEKSREKLGFINGTLLSDAYVVGTTRNLYLDSISFTIFGITILGIGAHGFLRWYFRRSIKKPMDSFVEESGNNKDKTNDSKDGEG